MKDDLHLFGKTRFIIVSLSFRRMHPTIKLLFIGMMRSSVARCLASRRKGPSLHTTPPQPARTPFPKIRLLLRTHRLLPNHKLLNLHTSISPLVAVDRSKLSDVLTSALSRAFMSLGPSLSQSVPAPPPPVTSVSSVVDSESLVLPSKKRKQKKGKVF